MLDEHFFLRDEGVSSGADSHDTPRHRWYPIKEAFSPRLVDAALESVKGDGLVIDPFCGSGTVPLTVACRGRSAVGIEVNPFLAFVSGVKLSGAKPATIRRYFDQIAKAARRGRRSALETFSTFSCSGQANKWLFNRDVLRAFEGGWQESTSLPDSSRAVFQLCLIRAAMDVCNAFRDGKCLRYHKDWKKRGYTATDFLGAFEARLTETLEDLSSSVLGHAEIINADSRLAISRFAATGFSLCITSPPYLNSLDYSDVYRPELFLGKFVKSNVELQDVRKRTLRSHVQVDWVRPGVSNFGEIYRATIDRVTLERDMLWSPRITLMVQAYFEDMMQILFLLRRTANTDARTWIVVSTSAYGGIEIPVDYIIAQIAEQCGWFVHNIGVLRHIRTSGHHWHKREHDDHPFLRESAIILGTKAQATVGRRKPQRPKPVPAGGRRAPRGARH